MDGVEIEPEPTGFILEIWTGSEKTSSCSSPVMSLILTEKDHSPVCEGVNQIALDNASPLPAAMLKSRESVRTFSV